MIWSLVTPEWLRGAAGAAAKVALACAVAFGVFKAIEHRGANKAVAKVERKDAANVSKAAAAARASRSGRGGVLDPNVRDD